MPTRTISAQTSLADLQAEYVDTCGYDLDGDAALCRRFVRVVRILLIRVPEVSKKSAGGAATELTWSIEQLRTELAKAERWLSANDSTFGAANDPGGGGVAFGSVSSSFRD